ncbi:HAD family hydrolase [Thalassotalea montiporae]
MTMSSTLNGVPHYKGVLFDLDGTLLDTANDLGEALNAVLTSHGLPKVPRERYRPVASDGAKGLIELGFGAGLKNFDYEQLRIEFLDYYENHIAEHTCLYPGVAALIEKLEQHQIPWGIVTNKPIGLTHVLLPHFPELKSAASVLGGDSLAQRKPHPAPLLQAANEIRVTPNECLYVGDAPRDIEAGNAANMCTIIAGWGYIASDTDLTTWQADIHCAHPSEINKMEFLFTKSPNG